MSAKPREYTSLPGSGYLTQGRIPVAFFRSRLYLGPDHLLRVERSSFSEKYRRFYYGDIKSIVLVKTATWLIVPILSLLVLMGCAAGIYDSWAEPGPIIAWSIPTLLFLFLLLRGGLRGPSCITHIRTGAGIEVLPSLNRLWTARRALRKMIPAITVVQGELPLLTEGAHEFPILDPAPAPGPAMTARATPTPFATPLVPPSAWLLWPSPLIALFSGLCFCAFILNFSNWFLIAGFILGIVTFIPTVTTLVRLSRARLPFLFGSNLALALVSLLLGATWYVDYIAASINLSFRGLQRCPRHHDLDGPETPVPRGPVHHRRLRARPDARRWDRLPPERAGRTASAS
ncbi:MAG: hypothetical protein QM796_17715 [Chthoniobacteraceae bacterium]